MPDLLDDRYPGAPDGSVEVEREKMTHDDVKYARDQLTQQSSTPGPAPTL